MKKYSLIAISVLAALMVAACSRSKLSPEVDENAWIYDETLPVPINLGSGPILGLEATKGAPIKTATMEGLKFRVIIADTITRYANSKVGTNRLLINSYAKSVDTKMQFLTSLNGTSVKRYYPMSGDTLSRFNYSFFAAYYPHSHHDGSTLGINPVVSDNWTTTVGTAYVTFPLRPYDSEQDELGDYEIYNVDVLYASSAVTTPLVEDNAKHLGYNANYVRRMKVHDEDYIPELAFSHVTSQIVIKVQAVDDDAAKTFYVDNDSSNSYNTGDDVALEVGKIKFCPRFSEAKLDFLTGKLTSNSSTVDNKAYEFCPTDSYWMPTETAQYYPFSQDQAAITAGTLDPIGLFIIPGERTNKAQSDASHPVTSPSVTLSIHLPLAPVGEQVKELEVELPAPLDGGKYQFKAGYRYVYTLTVNSIEEVVAQLSIEEWNTFTFNKEDNKTDGIIPIG